MLPVSTRIVPIPAVPPYIGFRPHHQYCDGSPRVRPLLSPTNIAPYDYGDNATAARASGSPARMHRWRTPLRRRGSFAREMQRESGTLRIAGDLAAAERC